MSHPSARTLERFSVGDLPADAMRDVEGHMKTCDACTRYVAELAAEHDERLAAVPPERFVAAVDARRRRVVSLADRRAVRAGVAFAAVVAAAAALVLVFRAPDSGDAGGGIALKGGGIAVYRNRGNDVRVLAAGDTIRAGDALRVAVTLPRSAPVAAWFVDARGDVDRVAPEGALPLPAGETVLPGSAVVDAPCLDLDVVAIVDIGSLDDSERALRGVGASSARPAGDAWVPKGAIVQHLRCE